MAGVSRLQYANEIRLIRVMCSGRVDLEFIIRAFLTGQDGVFIGGCRLNECNYVTQGNYDALGNTYLCKKILAHLGLNPERLRIEFMNASDGILLAEVITDFSKKVKALGPLGKAEGIAENGLKFKLEAAARLIPYIRLVERERLRVPVKSKEAYNHFFTSEELDRLFHELVADKLVISQIMLLLQKNPLSTGEISETLGLSPSEVSRHLSSSARHGLVRYDVAQKRFAAAGG
jgi:coenzyme F420-reducing hydrogenase delta subunit/predicted transcriptional regulator